MNNVEAPAIDHTATLTAIYEAFGAGNIPAILEHLDDNVAWEQWENNSGQQAGVFWLLPRHGKEGVQEFFKDLANLRFNRFDVISILTNDHQAAAEIAFDLDVLTTGGHIVDEQIHLWNFNEQGKVVRFRHYVDTAKHIAAANKNQ